MIRLFVLTFEKSKIKKPSSRSTCQTLNSNSSRPYPIKKITLPSHEVVCKQSPLSLTLLPPFDKIILLVQYYCLGATIPSEKDIASGN